MLSADRLNLDRAAVVLRDPFFIFEYEDVFDRDAFQRLDAEFPDKAEFPASWTNRGGKYYMDDDMPECADFVRRFPVWGELFDRFTDPRVIESFYELFRSAPAERSAHELRPWRIYRRPKLAGFGRGPRKTLRRLGDRFKSFTPVRLHFEFSYLENKCFIPPHTDTPGKLLTLMTYFPDSDAAYPVGTGTEFYRGKQGRATRPGWKAGMMDDDSMREFLMDHEIFYVADFTPNKLVGFVKSSCSWHGVQPLTLPPGITRRSLNINYYLA